MTTGSAPRRKLSKATIRQNVLGYLWISPWLLGFLFFTLGPMVASLGFSFTNYRIINDARWIGLDNYIYALVEDDLFWPSLGKTFYFVLVSVPLGLLGSLLLAMLLNIRLRGETIFRTLFFLPSLTPLAAAAILWIWILHPQVGLVNYLLSLVGISGPAWAGLYPLGVAFDYSHHPVDEYWRRQNDHFSGRVAGRAPGAVRSG